MTAIRTFLARLLGAVTGRRRDRVLREEIDTHLSLLADEFLARGLTPAQARAAARREFGGVEATRESARDERGFPALESLRQDIGYALRQLRQQPGFSAAAILILGLGIGANTGLFSVVDAIMLRPLPYPDPDRLVVIHERQSVRGMIPVSPADADAWRASTSSFEQIALLFPDNANVSEGGEPIRIPAARVSPSVMPMLGIRTGLGRLFRDDEDAPGHDRVALISDSLWRGRFNADPEIIGRQIRMNGVPHEIVGVLARGSQPPDLRYLYPLTFQQDPPQIWRPLAIPAALRTPVGGHSYASIARLRPGVSLSQASIDLEAAQAQVRRDIPAKGDIGTAIVPLQRQLVGRSRAGLQLLFLAVTALMLIGCINIANLVLTRAISRRREFAVRQALGAGRARLARQVLVENLTLCVFGGLVGIAIAQVAIRGIMFLAPADMPRVTAVELDSRALLVIGGLTLLTAMLIGSVPAFRAGKPDLMEAMKARSHGGTAPVSKRLHTALVGSQIALSALCLIVAGLLLQSFVRLMENEKGFNADHVLTLDLNLAGQRYANEQLRGGFSERLLERVQRIPGVMSAATASLLPLTGQGATSAVSIEGDTSPATERPAADVRSVTPAYFQTLGIALRDGRLLEDADRQRFVTVVSASLAARAWPGQNPLGQRFRLGVNPATPLYEIVGVVADVRNNALDQPPTSTAYVPFPQRSYAAAAVLVRSSQDPSAQTGAIRHAVREVDAELPVGTFRTIDDIVQDATAQRSFQMRLVMAFAVAGVMLATLGVYSLLAYSVAQRHAEFGVRLALGARPNVLSTIVLKEAMHVIGGGLVVAIAGALALGSVLRSFLFGVAPNDPGTLLAVGALMAATALLAAYIPSRRASRVDPMTALRGE